MRKQIHLIVLILLCAVAGFAQRPKTYSTTNVKAIRTYENARRLFDERRDQDAEREAYNAAKIDAAFVEPYLLLANIYTEANNKEKAKESYRKAVEVNPGFFPKALLTLGELEFNSGEYAAAKEHLEKFVSYNDRAEALLTKGNRLLKNAEFAMEAVKHPVPYNPHNLGDSINTSMDEYFPAITADGATFLFTRRLRTTKGNGRSPWQEDFYVSNLEGGAWTNAAPVKEINTGGNEGAPSLSADGQYLFFTACKELEGYPGNRTGHGSCDIFIAKKIGNKWMNPRNLEQPINSGNWESQPSFSSDGRTLYFVRADKNPNSTSDRNIYTTRIGDDGTWSEPEKLGDNINTTGDEQSVFIHPDNQTLYFSSNGHPGMGGLDIFMSRLQPDGEWGPPVNLGYPINTIGDENSLLVGPSGDIAYFSSDRPGGKGGIDLYSFDLYDSAKPQKVAYLKGHVMDEVTKASLAANFELIDLATGKLAVSSTSNSGNGEFLVVLPAGKNYALNVSRENYLFFSEHFEFKDVKSSTDPVLKDIFLKPIKAGESVVLNNVFFATDAYELKPESKIELNKLVAFMNKNAAVKIEIGGHTDNTGGKQHNVTLSEKRAKAVYDYLLESKIVAARLSFKGYADTKPLADNASEAGRAQNRRTEFKVVSVN